jgi:membrane-bound lytic murein transglycosylase B
MDRGLFQRKGKVLILSNPWLSILFVSLLTVLLLLPCPVFADWSPLIDRLVTDGFEESTIRDLFSRPEVRFEPNAMSTKIEELLKYPPGGKAATWVPTYNPKVVYKHYLKEKTLGLARSYLRENAGLLDYISNGYCVPKEVIVSILLVETRLGDFVGKQGAFNSLASMALCTELETIRSYLPKKLISSRNETLARTVCYEKADWAYAELKALLLYTDRNGFDPVSLPGSIYGAIGLCQFMPSNSLFYGVDGDEDGRIDLFTKTDALFSIANYLQGHGWDCKMDKTGQLRVVLDYNKSSIYANTVLSVAEKIKEKEKTDKLKEKAKSKTSSKKR